LEYCRLCTRYFYGDEAGKVKNGICDYCETKIAKLKESLPFETSREELESLVSEEQKRRLERLSPWEVRKRIKESKERDQEV